MLIIIMKDPNKLIQYVKKGSLHKVKRCLRKWKKEGQSINDVKTGSGRTLLHLACYHGEDAITRALLRAGCDANSVDKDGNAPIHLVLNRVLEGDVHLMCDLVEPLLLNATSNDVVQRQRNHLGLTPAVLLTRARNYIAELNKASSSHRASASWHQERDQDWNEKLSSEWAYESNQMDGDSYWSSFNGENHRTEETYDDWASRMTFEYHTKRSDQKEHHRKSKKTRDKTKENEKLLRNLQKEHAKYLQKQKQKVETRLKKKKEEYLVLSNTFFNNNNDDANILFYDDIPWPGRMSDVDGMLEVLQYGVKEESLKKFVLSQLKFWHPDKFQQKFDHRLSDDKERILKQVNELSQGLNKLAEDKTG